MSFGSFLTRFKKLLFSINHKKCWRALSLGVGPSTEHLSVLKKIRPDAILDAGANKGQFALISKVCFSGVPVLSFEPLPDEIAIFKKIHSDDQIVELFECALGEEKKTATLNLSNRRDSSSLLPIGKLQSEIFSQTHHIGTLEIKLEKLDDFKSHFVNKHEMLLKIDVQGFELSVLKGAVETLKQCKYVYVECSEVPLYEGQALRKDVEAFLCSQGFLFKESTNKYFLDNKLIQADHLFIRQTDSL